MDCPCNSDKHFKLKLFVRIKLIDESKIPNAMIQQIENIVLNNFLEAISESDRSRISSWLANPVNHDKLDREFEKVVEYSKSDPEYQMIRALRIISLRLLNESRISSFGI